MNKKLEFEEKLRLVLIQVGILAYAIRRMFPMTKTQLRKLSGVSTYLIFMIEHGQSNIDICKFERMLKALDYLLSEFFYIQESKFESERFLRKFQKRCSIDKDKVNFLLRYWSENPPKEKDPIYKLFPKSSRPFTV